MRTVCTGLPSTRRSRRRSPASYSVSASSSRSRITSAAMRSASVCSVDGVERAERGPVELGALGGAVGGEVGHLVVVAGDALTGRGQRIERGEPLDVVVGEVVDGLSSSLIALLFSRGW